MRDDYPRMVRVLAHVTYLYLRKQVIISRKQYKIKA